MRTIKLVDKEKFLARAVATPLFITALLLAFHDTLWVWSWIPTLMVWAYVIRNYKTGRWTI